MKFVRFILPAVVFPLSLMGFARTGPAPAKPVTATQMQNSFTLLKSLAGVWKGTVNYGGKRVPMTVWMRVTSRGHVLVHELQAAGTRLNAAKYDHPVSMIYEHHGHLVLIHYCDAGNRPRMRASLRPEGKKISFQFARLSGTNKNGHMADVVFTLISPNHHLENWTWMEPDNKTIEARMDLRRISDNVNFR